MSTRAANHSWYNMVVAYGSIEGGASYNDTTAQASVAAFLLVRGQHWLFSIGEKNSCNPLAYPGAEGYRPGTPQCNASTNVVNPATCASPARHTYTRTRTHRARRGIGVRNGVGSCRMCVYRNRSAALLVTDFGRPTGLAKPVPGKPHVFSREYDSATVTLDCNTFTGSFAPH